MKDLLDFHVPKFRVIGFHGQLGVDQTPARREAVIVDTQNRIINPRTLEVLSEPIVGELPGIGTFVSPWPAQPNYHFVIVGPRERKALGSINLEALTNNGRVTGFLHIFLGIEWGYEESLTYQRLDNELVAWYCSDEEASALWKLVHEAAFEELRSAARWYRRTVVTDEDEVRATKVLKVIVT